MNRINAITAALYIFLFLGLVLTFLSSFERLGKAIRSRVRLKELTRRLQQSHREEPRLADLLELSIGMKGAHADRWFLAGCLSLALIVFLALFAAFNPRLGLFGGFCAGCCPYLLVRTRLQNKQVDLSREGEQLLTELLNNYRICRFSMREAVEKTALTIEEAPLSKKLLLSLSRELNEASGKEQVRRAIEKFRLAFSTSWGDLLAANLEFAEADGIIVTESLKDLVSGIADARRKLEQNKRETSDSAAVLHYLFPITLLMIYFGAVFCFGLSTSQFLHNQFRTQTGMGWFIALCFSFVVSMMISAFTARQKMDL